MFTLKKGIISEKNWLRATFGDAYQWHAFICSTSSSSTSSCSSDIYKRW